MRAFIYARWSSLEQSAGSTLARQLEVCGSYVASQPGWTLVETLMDKGKSAYTGANIETGALGKFRDRVMSGALNPTDVVLVVEELDRLSRQPADVMLTWLSPLVRKGLTIKVVNSGQLITRDMLDHDMGGLMMILITAFGSHSESAKKAKRVAAAWEEKRRTARAGEAIKDKHKHHRRPKWVEIDDKGEFLVPETKARIIRLIFENRIKGIGKMLMAMKLNELAKTDAAYAPWQLDAGKRKSPELWTATYVGRILRNRSVLGEWQPYARPRNGEVRQLEPVPNYYPRVIDDATFVRANDGRIADALKHQGRGRNLSNLLGTKARCGVCGGQMGARGSASYVTHSRGVSRHYFLYCNSAKLGKTCENQMGWTYDRVENPVLDRILAVAMDDEHFTADADVGPFEAAVHNAKASIVELERKIDLAIDLVMDGGGERAKARVIQHQNELEVAKEALAKSEEELAAARGAVSPHEHVRRVSEVRALMAAEDPDVRFDARSKIKAALGDVIESMRFMPESGQVRVRLIDGMRSFVITHKGEVLHDFDFSKDDGDDYRYIEDPEERERRLSYARRVRDQRTKDTAA